MELKNVLNFLKELSANNNKDWFHANKAVYQEALAEFKAFTEALIGEIASFDKDIASLRAKDCIFRIYRDIRFSKDKTPYKNNFGAAFIRGGKKSPYAAYYIHIEPGESFCGGGIWMPPGNILKAVRQEVYYHSEEFIKILETKKFKETFGQLGGDKLQRPPVGFPKDFPHNELLKFKSYAVMKNMPDERVLSGDLLKDAKADFKTMYPFIQFLNRAVGNMS
jgi:uncharacterized protein (TIGR02453 family)